MSLYRTLDGDRLDLICLQHYHRQSHAVEALLAANPGLADQPPILPPGTLILLPPPPQTTPPDTTVKLWD